MTYKAVINVTTRLNQDFAEVSDWLATHGPCGTRDVLCLSTSFSLTSPRTATGTYTFESIDDWQEFIAKHDSDRQHITLEIVSAAPV
jgi:hypothetical protein